jgi:hypothetical protein
VICEQADPEVGILIGAPFIVGRLDSGSYFERNEPAFDAREGWIARRPVVVGSVPADVPDSEAVRRREVVNLDFNRCRSEVDVLGVAPERIGRKSKPGFLVVALPIQRSVLAIAGCLTRRDARRQREQDGNGQRREDQIGDLLSAQGHPLAGQGTRPRLRVLPR